MDQLTLDIGTLSAAYAAGKLSPEALVEALYTRIAEGAHPNVFIHLAPKAELLAAARALGAPSADKPLWGIPFAVKDNIDVAGMPTTAACPGYSYLPERSAPVVARLIEAGALCFGKTNLDQFATGLVGTRSPYGACHNVFDPAYVSGGSSSGSAVAVAVGYVSVALGTDTAGSGRVPAAFGNIVGVKPTRGLLSTAGVVPACASLDCVSVFALCCADGARTREIMLADSAAPPIASAPIAGLRIGVPAKPELFGDELSREAYERALQTLRRVGADIVPIDFGPFDRIGGLLYGGPWVAERTLAVGEFIRARPDACLPITREIILGGERFSAMDAFRGQYALSALLIEARRAFEPLDALLMPTAPTIYTRAAEASDRSLNDKLGIYTRFANFLGLPVLALPAGFREDGLPFGISIAMREHEDRALDRVGLAIERVLKSGMGLRVDAKPTSARSANDASAPPLPGCVRLAVVGAHLRGEALNHELVTLRARFVRATRTCASYRLFALPNTKPLKPGLTRVASGGASIEIELWDLSAAAFGSFVSKIPSPLGIGTLECEDGERVKGFLCESVALEGALDISRFGGFKAYLSSLRD